MQAVISVKVIILKNWPDFQLHLITEKKRKEKNKVDTTNRCEALKEVMSLNYV